MMIQDSKFQISDSRFQIQVVDNMEFEIRNLEFLRK